MATIVSTREAEAQIADLIERALSGEEIVIEGAGTGAVKLTPVATEPSPEKRPLRFGNAKGQITIHPSFFDPMTEEELELWEGKSEAPPA